MIRTLAWVLALGTPVAAVAAAPPRDPAPLKLTGKWVANYDVDACHLLGQFGTGKDMVILRMTKYQRSDSFDLALLGKRLWHTEPTIDATVDFGIRPQRQEKVMLGRSGEYPGVYFRSIRLDGWQWGDKQQAQSLTPEQEGAITGLTVTLGSRRSIRLETGSLAKPMAVMRKCLDDLVKSWGYDPAEQAALSRPAQPITPPYKWLRDTDYPRAAVWQGINGAVQFRLDISADGRVENCHILARTNPDEFSDLTCAAIKKRAVFDAALDAQGKPVRAYYVNSARFMMGT